MFAAVLIRRPEADVVCCVFLYGPTLFSEAEFLTETADPFLQVAWRPWDPCLCPTSTGVTCMEPRFLEVAGDLNSGSQVYAAASTLPTELPLQNLSFRKLRFLNWIVLGIEGQIDRTHERQAVL